MSQLELEQLVPVCILNPLVSIMKELPWARSSLAQLGTRTSYWAGEGEPACGNGTRVSLRRPCPLLKCLNNGFYLAFSKKVDGSALGLKSGTQICPAMAKWPAGWDLALGLVSEALREVVFVRAGIARPILKAEADPGDNVISEAVDDLLVYPELETCLGQCDPST